MTTVEIAKVQSDSQCPDVLDLVSGLTLRVVEYFDTAFEEYIAVCLETGALAAEQSAENAKTAVLRVISTQIQLAVESDDFTSLFSTPAQGFDFARWFIASAQGPVTRTHLQIPVMRRPAQSEVSPLVHFAKQLA
jgi:hypothetical protein